MNHGRIQLAEGEFRDPKKKKVKPGTILRDPYPIIFWNKLGVPPCKELWPCYMGAFDGDSVIVEDPEDIHEISTMGYFGKRLMCRRGYEPCIGDVPVVRERQWKRRVEWAAECGYVLVPPDDKGSEDGLSHTLECQVDNAESGTLPERGLEEEVRALDKEQEVLLEDPSEEGEHGSEITNGCLGGEPGGMDVHSGDEKKEGKGKDSNNATVIEEDSCGHGSGAPPQVRQDSPQESIISGASGNRQELRGQQEEIEESGTDGKCTQSSHMDEEGVVQQSVSDESKGKSDSEVVALEDKEMRRGSGEGTDDFVEEADSVNVQPSKTEGGAAMEASTDRLSRDGKGQVDQQGKGDESPLVVTSSGRSEGDLQEIEGTKKEIGLGRSEEVGAGKGVESPEGKEMGSSKLKGRMDRCHGARKSPRSTKNSISKSKEGEHGECDSLTGMDQVVSGESVRRSPRKSLAQEGSGNAYGSNGDSGAGSRGSVSNKILDKSCPKDRIKAGKNDEKEKISGVEEKEGIFGSSSKEVEKIEKEKSPRSKRSEKSSDVLEKSNEELDDSEMKSKEPEKTCKVSAKDESPSPGRTRGPKRNRSSSSGDMSSVGKVEEECGEGSTERMSEDLGKVVAKRVKISDTTVVEEAQQIVVNVSTTEINRADGSDMRTKVEPRMTEEPIEKEGRRSSSRSREKDEEVDEHFLSKSSPVEEKNDEEANLNKGSSDCEIVEIDEFESNVQNPNLSRSETQAAGILTSTPLKNSVRGSPKKDAPCVTEADSDDDIMEVSIEVVEVREVPRNGPTNVNRRCRSSGVSGEGLPGNRKDTTNGKSCNATEQSRFQNLLREIRRTLPKDIEVVQLNLKDLKEEASSSRECQMNVPGVGTSNNDDDDDVIEINLQQSDMLELEDCDGEEEVGVGGADDGDDGEIDCRIGEQTRCLRRRMMRKESSGFRRRDRFGESGGDLFRMKQEIEVEGTESIATVNLGSDCEVAPCVVIPDSDSEAEETQGSPRLESDPSVFLPSLDVLQLIPEEAFFLAYGLGCLMVWDTRNMDLDPNKCDDHDEVTSAPVNKTLSKDCSDELKLNGSTEREDAGIGDETGNIPSMHINLDDRGHTMKTSNPSDHSEDSSSKSINGCDSGDHPGHPDKGSITHKSIKHVENPVVEQSKLDSVVEDDSNKSLNRIESSSSHETYPPVKVPPGEASNKVPVEAVVSANLDQEEKVSMEKESKEEIGVLDVKNKSEPIPVNVTEQKNKSNLDSNINNSLSIIYDGGSSDEMVNESRNQKKEYGKNESSCFAEKREGIDDSYVSPKENGDLGDPSITIIDLADSPPSRQWARKGWPSQDEEDVVDMDTHAYDVSLVDSEPSVLDHPNERTLSSEYQRPMSITELWNTFKACRATVSSAIPFETTYAVYHHFRSKGWVVKPGIRFGGDFLLYKDGPPFYHASYLVVIDSSKPDEESKFDWNMLSGLNRLAENIAKDLMLCRVEWPFSITEEELQSPHCLTGLVIQEVLIRRWVSVKERDAGHQLEEEDDDQESFIPLKL